MTMEKCLDENELVDYTDWLQYGAGKPDSRLIIHVEGCPDCRRNIMEICELMDQVEAGA
jgi:hypothetical protein